MIKFFRTIRKKLLAEGKTFRYLKYALGEIILVVIGILIALEINNRNELHKNDKREVQYIKALYDEIKMDTADYARTNIRLLKQENAAKYTVEVLESASLQPNDSLNFINQLKLMYLYDLEVPSPIIWNELQNTGNLRLIKNRGLLDQLNSYYNLIDRIKYRMQNINISKFSNRGREFDSNVFSTKESDEYFKNFKLSKKPSDKTFIMIFSDPEILAISKGIYGYTKVGRINVNFLNRIATSTLEVLKKNIDSLETL